MSEIIDETNSLRYTNISFKNNASFPVMAKVAETRTSPILTKPSNWLLSVIRFDVDSQALPINIPLMKKLPPPFNNSTQSTITFEYKGVDYSNDVQYLSASSLPIYDFPTIYNYQDWLRMVNLTMALTFLDTGAVGDPPLFIYDSKTGLINLYVDSNFLPAAGANRISIFMNQQLFGYFTNFRYAYKIIDPTNPLLDHLIEITGDNAIVLPAVGSRTGLPLGVQTGYTNLAVISDSAPSTASWSSVRSMILSSGAIPFRSETIPDRTINSDNYSSDNSFPILSDFLIPVESKVTDYRVVNEYLPTAQYRYLDLTSDTPLTTLDLKFYWTDFSGNIYPLYILPQKTFSVKLLFEKRKSFIKK